MRDLSERFLDAMRKGLDKGRREKGYSGWDVHWKGVKFPIPPMDWMIMRLHQEVDELIIAIYQNDPEKILGESADVANFAMFIADISR